MFNSSQGCRKLGKFVLKLPKRWKSLNSAEWLKRKMKDPYTELARIENYRCRSAFKLLEIDDRFKLIQPGQIVIDIGAAPGSWTQVLVKRTNAIGDDKNKPKGMVISVDRSPIYELEGATILSGMDFTKSETQTKINEVMNGKKLNFVFSDMAPNATGIKPLDADKIFELATAVMVFALKNLCNNGGLLLKMWEGRHSEIAQQMNRFFTNFNYIKPNSSYKESDEIFLLGRQFKGIIS